MPPLQDLDPRCYQIEEIYNLLSASKNGMSDAVLRSRGIHPGTREERLTVDGLATIESTLTDHWRRKAEQQNVNKTDI